MSFAGDPNPDDPTASGGAGAVKRAFGGLLMVVGWLMVGLCGLCSATFIVAMIAEAFRSGSGGDVIGFTTMALVIGGVPIAIGAGLIWLGRRLRRGPAKP